MKYKTKREIRKNTRQMYKAFGAKDHLVAQIEKGKYPDIDATALGFDENHNPLIRIYTDAEELSIGEWYRGVKTDVVFLNK